MTTAAPPAQPAEVETRLAALAPREVAVGIVTYNNAATVAAVAEAARLGVEKHVATTDAVLLDADAASTDATGELVRGCGLEVVELPYQAPVGERVAVPFHGVPGRATALSAILGGARRLDARVLVLLEADVPSVTEEWIGRLMSPVREGQADLVVAAHERHRYDGTLTSLVLAPLVRALLGCRLQQPLLGAAAMSARLIAHLAEHRERLAPPAAPELGVVGAVLAGGFALAEVWLGPRRVESPTRPVDLPTVVAQSVGAVFTAMEALADTWLGTRGSRSVTVLGEPRAPSTEPRTLAVERMVAAFEHGLRDLIPVWELALAPETLHDVLGLGAAPPDAFRFPDDLWARVVYDFALAHRYRVVHREHLLRSLVPLYLGRTAAYVLATRERDAAAAVAHLEAAGTAFERQKPYLVERWR